MGTSDERLDAVLAKIPVRAQAAVVAAVFRLPRVVRRMVAGAPVRIDGQDLALDAQLLLALNRVADRGMVRKSPKSSRAAMARSAPLVGGPPEGPAETREVVVGGVSARLTTPVGVADPAPALIFFHGGGWVVGTVDSHDATCRFLAVRAGVKVLSVDYRLAPEHPFPSGADDALAAFLDTVARADELGIDPRRVAVGGDSAGGNLAAVTAHRATRAGGPRPAFQLLFYPATDATVRRRSRDLFAEGFFLGDSDIDWFLDHYCPDVSRRADPALSVLRADDLTGLPPCYLATAGFDPLRDEGEAYAARLAAAGVPVVLSRQSDLIHGYASFLGVGTRFREATAEAAGALRTGLALSGRQDP